MSFHILKLSTASVLILALAGTGCNRNPNNDGEKITADQKKKLENLESAKAEAARKAAEADAKNAEASAKIQKVSEEEAQLKVSNDTLEADRSSLEQMQLQVGNAIKSNDQTAEAQKDLKDKLAALSSKVQTEQQQVDAKSAALSEQEKIIQNNVAELKKEFISVEEGRTAENEAMVAGKPFPRIAIVTGDTFEQHTEIMKALQAIDNRVRIPGYHKTQTVGTSIFIFSTSKVEDLNSLEALVADMNNVNISFAPLYRVVVKTYINLYYSKAIRTDATRGHEMIFIGDSSPAVIGTSYSQISIDDVFNYAKLPVTCKSVSADCVMDLRKAGYIDGADKVFNGQSVSNYLVEKLQNSSVVTDNFHGQLNSAVITDITLSHRVFAQIDKKLIKYAKEDPTLVQLPLGTPTERPAAGDRINPRTKANLGDALSKALMANIPVTLNERTDDQSGKAYSDEFEIHNN